MDLDWNETQELLRKTARGFFARECPPARVKEIEKTEAGYAPELWSRMAGLGWLGLAVPEAYGGSGGTFMDVAALAEEMGRAAFPSPYLSTVALCSHLVMSGGTEAQKQRLLPAIAQGRRVLALALTEEDASYRPEYVLLRAVRSGGGYVLNGAKLFVLDGNVADELLVVARTRAATSPGDGLSVFLVEAQAPGVKRIRLQSFGGEAQAEVQLRDVRVTKDALLGELHKGWPLAGQGLQRASIALCAQMAGGAQQALELAVDYAKKRVQFGRPIGSFQAIQHKCADMVTDVDILRYLTYYAAWKISDGLPAALEVAQAKAWASDAYRRVAREAHQIFAGIAFVDNHDLQLYFRRAKAGEVLFGDAAHHLELVADALNL